MTDCVSVSFMSDTLIQYLITTEMNGNILDWKTPLARLKSYTMYNHLYHNLTGGTGNFFNNFNWVDIGVCIYCKIWL